MVRKTKHLIVLSLDALGSVDFSKIEKLPNIGELLKCASYSKNVHSVYPTLTYPSHTSILTGCLPRRHGIVNNTKIQPKRKKPDWFWYQKDVKVPSLVDVAIENDMKVASLLWPVLGGSKVQYNMPEIWANRCWQNQLLVSLCAGSPKYLYELNKLFGKHRKGIQQPELDNFIHHSALHTLKKYKPDLMLVHFLDLDDKKHHFGCETVEVDVALTRLDSRVGDFISVLKENGMYEDTTLVILGDHSQKDAHTIIYLNQILFDAGFIEYRDGRIVDYQALAKSCDGSTYIYLKDRSVRGRVYELLTSFAKISENGISKIFEESEIIELGADSCASFMLEATEGFYFLDEIGLGVHRKIEVVEHSYSHALIGVHGYLPTLPNYQTVFIASGAGIKSSVEISQMSLIDQGPTLAKLLGLKLPLVDGRVLHEILE